MQLKWWSYYQFVQAKLNFSFRRKSFERWSGLFGLLLGSGWKKIRKEEIKDFDSSPNCRWWSREFIYSATSMRQSGGCLPDLDACSDECGDSEVSDTEILLFLQILTEHELLIQNTRHSSLNQCFNSSLNHLSTNPTYNRIWIKHFISFRKLIWQLISLQI